MVGEGAMRGYFSSMIQTGIGSTLNYGFEGEFKGLLNNRYADSEAFKSVVTNGLTAGAGNRNLQVCIYPLCCGPDGRKHLRHGKSGCKCYCGY